MDTRHLFVWAMVAVALLAPGPAGAQATDAPMAAKGVVYHCLHPDGSIEYTKVPAVSCTVLFTVVPAEWRVIASDGHSASAWRVSFNEYWRNKEATHADTIVWLYASPQKRRLTGETQVL